MNEMRPVAKCDNLYTLSLFALKLWLLRLKYIFVSGLVKNLQLQNETYQSQLKQFVHTSEKTTLSYKCLKKNPKQFFYMSGLSVEDFDCLFASVEPYIPAIMYPDCKAPQQRKLTKRTELMCFMTVCRHALHLGIVGYMTDTSVTSTQSRIFKAWADFFYQPCLIS